MAGLQTVPPQGTGGCGWETGPSDSLKNCCGRSPDRVTARHWRVRSGDRPERFSQKLLWPVSRPCHRKIPSI